MRRAGFLWVAAGPTRMRSIRLAAGEPADLLQQVLWGAMEGRPLYGSGGTEWPERRSENRYGLSRWQGRVGIGQRIVEPTGFHEQIADVGVHVKAAGTEAEGAFKARHQRCGSGRGK